MVKSTSDPPGSVLNPLRPTRPQLGVAPTTAFRDPQAEAITRECLDLLFPDSPAEGAIFRLWNGEVWPRSAGYPYQFAVVLNHPGALRRMFLPFSEKNVGEAYVRGDFDIEGDVVAAMSLGPRLQRALADVRRWPALLGRLKDLPRSGPDSAAWRGSAVLAGRKHSIDRDKEAVTYHYDLPTEFYLLFLDRRMQYSCAYFKNEGYSLDAAQEAKLEHICRKLDLRPGEQLLDIGCGWGGLIAYAAEHYGVQAVGITISPEQAQRARRDIAALGLQDRCKVELCDYRNLPVVEGFDKVVSVGMFEHVGRPNLPVYFRKAWSLMKPGGRFLCHGIAGVYPSDNSFLLDFVGKRVYRNGSFLLGDVFPDAELIPISETLNAAEHEGLEVRDVESLREHYARTLRHWISNLDRNREQVVALVGDSTYRVWRLYMAGCAYTFQTHFNSVYQSLLVKNTTEGKSGLPPTRDYMYSGD